MAPLGVVSLEKDVIFTTLKNILTSEFNLDGASITPEARFEEDLDLDSLDAVDLLISLGDNIKGEADPGLFKGASTIGDIVDMLVPIWKA